MDWSIQASRVRLAKVAAVLIVGSAWIAPQAFAQLLPPLGSLIVTITSPTSGSSVSGTVPVSASVSIVGALTVSSVQFRLDGANLGAPDTSAPYSVSWNTTTVGNGSHTLTAVATDILGARWNSAPVTVAVSNGPPPDTTPPSVPTGLRASAVSSSQINLSWTASSDNVGVSGYRVYRGGTQIATTSATSFINTGLSPSTTYTYAVAAFDAAGNLSAQSSPASATTPAAPDTTPPTVSITSPASGATVSGTATIVSASASDNVGVIGVQFQLDGANLGGQDTSAPYSVSWNTTTASNGSHTLTAIARDAAGNSRTSAQVTVTVNNAPPPDTTPPTVSITSPSNGQTVSATVTVTANASDNVGVAGVQFVLDNGTNIGAEDTSAPYSVSWNTTGAANGSHTLTAVARDAAGNRTTSAQVTVTVANAPPVDTTPPTVSITSPSNGQTVSATVTVTANASDNVGVAGVQFVLDNGTNIGAEDTSAPYSVSWNTTGTPNGSHTLTAVARDAAGNRTTSAQVTVTVSNAAPAAKRFEETDPSIAYTAGWISDNHGSLSNGGAAISEAAGAQATFTFSGTSVSWIGGRSFETGIARVSLDGSFVREIDTYSKTAEVQVPMFTAVGLANTTHTLTIEVTGRKNAAATLAYVFVDAFDVPAATISRLQEMDPSVTYTGSGWVLGDTSEQWSGGTAAGSVTAGDQATFTFTGTGIRALSARGPQNGIARVFLDGVFMAEVDTYAPPFVNPPGPVHQVQVQAELFKATGLANQSHTLMIEVTGRFNPPSTAAIVTVDAFEVTTSGTRHQETDPAITYTAGWVRDNRDHPYSEGTAAVSAVRGDQATFTFTGTSVSWVGYRGPQTGIARVILDGSVVADALDTYTQWEVPQTTVYTLPGLANTSHTLTIEVTGSKNPASGGVAIVVDAFDVNPTSLIQTSATSSCGSQYYMCSVLQR